MDIFRLTNDELIRRTEELAADLRRKSCELIESLVEIDRRRLFREHQCVSLFEYCVSRLRMSEAAAYRRIRAARAFQAYPPVKPLLREGKLSLESLALIHPFLNEADAGKLVAEASGKRVWEVERLIASRRTEEPRRDVVRFIASSVAVPPPPAEPLFARPMAVEPPPVETRLAVGEQASDLPSPAASSEGRPGAADREIYPPMPAAMPSVPVPPPEPPAPRPPPSGAVRHAVRIAFTTDEAFFRLLKEAQAAMRHKYPDGRLDGVFRDALEALLRRKRPWAFPRTGTATS